MCGFLVTLPKMVLVKFAKPFSNRTLVVPNNSGSNRDGDDGILETFAEISTFSNSCKIFWPRI